MDIDINLLSGDDKPLVDRIPEEQVANDAPKESDEWWCYVPSSFLDTHVNNENTPVLDNEVEYRIVVTDQAQIGGEGEFKERVTRSDTRVVTIGEEAAEGENPNVDARMYRLRVAENYPVVQTPSKPAVDWSLPAPNPSFPSSSSGAAALIVDKFRVKYFNFSEGIVTGKMKELSNRVVAKYGKNVPVFFKVDFESSQFPGLGAEDVFNTSDGNRLFSSRTFTMFMHVKCFQYDGRAYKEKLRYSGKTGPNMAVAMSPFNYSFVTGEEVVGDSVFWLEFLYPNMTDYDQIEVFFEMDTTDSDGAPVSLYSETYTLRRGFREPIGHLASLRAVDLWRGDERELALTLRRKLADMKQEADAEREIAAGFDSLLPSTDLPFDPRNTSELLKPPSVADATPKKVGNIGSLASGSSSKRKLGL